jgi:hypothetical protein
MRIAREDRQSGSVSSSILVIAASGSWFEYPRVRKRVYLVSRSRCAFQNATVNSFTIRSIRCSGMHKVGEHAVNGGLALTSGEGSNGGLAVTKPSALGMPIGRMLVGSVPTRLQNVLCLRKTALGCSTESALPQPALSLQDRGCSRRSQTRT